MNFIQQFGNRLNTRFVIIGLAIWWLSMLIIYAGFTLRVNHLKGQLRKSGVEITREFSNLVSLPLLEKNSQSISKLLTDAASKADVIYALVVDHRNKVVAFTGTGHLMPDMTETARSVDKVSIWEGGFASHARILNFASDITFSDTKIGEIFIGLSTPEMFQTRRQFIWIAVISCLLSLLLVVALFYQTIIAFVKNYLKFDPSQTVTESGSSSALVYCPLCGTQHPLSRKLFKRSCLDQFLKASDPNSETNPAHIAATSGPDLQAPGKKQDLSWIKRQIILRCTEIIKKLAT